MAELTRIDLALCGDGEYHVWLRGLDQEKRARVEKTKSPLRRRQIAAGDYLARAAVAKLTGAAPSQVDFHTGENGRPATRDAYFSVSHSGTQAVCAAGTRPVGVDTERIRDYDPRIVQRLFTAAEQTYLAMAATEERRRVRFWHCWTGKEAIGKYFGGGLRAVAHADTRGRNPGLRLQWSVAEGYVTCVAEQEPLAETALTFLQRDEALYMDLIDPIRRGSAEILQASADGVLIRELRSGVVSAAGADDAAELRLVDSLPAAELARREQVLTLHRDGAAQELMRRAVFQRDVACRQGVYLQTTPLAEDARLTVREAGEAELPLIDAHYDKENLTVLRALAEAGDLFVAAADGEMVGFVGSHEDGSAGLLCVLPPYRRCGYAIGLEGFINNRVLERGLTPYGQIEVWNESSLHLQQKLGLTISAPTQHYLLHNKEN